jgi:hypothetical protein
VPLLVILQKKNAYTKKFVKIPMSVKRKSLVWSRFSENWTN